VNITKILGVVPEKSHFTLDHIQALSGEYTTFLHKITLLVGRQERYLAGKSSAKKFVLLGTGQ